MVVTCDIAAGTLDADLWWECFIGIVIASDSFFGELKHSENKVSFKMVEIPRRQTGKIGAPDSNHSGAHSIGKVYVLKCI